jgi:outer membrane beta-barrel protein
MYMKKTMTIFLMLLLLTPVHSFAQATEAEELNIIELELDKEAPKPAPPVTEEPAPIQEPAAAAGPAAVPETQQSAPVREKPLTFSGLGTLAPFSDISIIQKRFLPKTGRFQLFGGGTILTNNPFFNTMGGVAKASYFLSETWGLELNYFGLTTAERQATQELKEIQGVKTENLVYPLSYTGVDIVFLPIYGKMAWFNEKIVPFDLYFSAGYGTTNTQAGENAGTVHLATGQIFAISKAYAFRWDFSWNFFNATGVDGSTNSFNNLFLTVGMSWFFPEASYR